MPAHPAAPRICRGSAWGSFWQPDDNGQELSSDKWGNYTPSIAHSRSLNCRSGRPRISSLLPGSGQIPDRGAIGDVGQRRYSHPVPAEQRRLQPYLPCYIRILFSAVRKRLMHSWSTRSCGPAWPGHCAWSPGKLIRSPRILVKRLMYFSAPTAKALISKASDVAKGQLRSD